MAKRKSTQLAQENARLRARIAELEGSEDRVRMAARDARLRLAVQATGIGLWTFEAASNKTAWHEGMRELFGLDHTRNVEEYVELAVHPDDREAVRESMVTTFATGEFQSCLHRIVRGDGEIRWVLPVATATLDEAGNIARLDGGHVDVTELRRMDQQLRSAQRMEVVGSLTAGVAHNFNNLLTVILPCLELLRRDVAPQLVDLVDEAAGAAQRASELVRQLMLFAGHRRRHERAAPFDVPAMAIDAVAMFQSTFEKTVRVEVELARDVPPAFGDHISVQQALVNVLTNARDAVLAAAVAEPFIEVTIDEVRIAGPKSEGPRKPGHFVRLTVTDNGSGMDAAVQSRMFDPFFSTKPAGFGTGLGLSTCHAIIEELDGWLDCRSQPGHGTTFVMAVPVHVRAAAERDDDRADEARADNLASPARAGS